MDDQCSQAQHQYMNEATGTCDRVKENKQKSKKIALFPDVGKNDKDELSLVEVIVVSHTKRG